MKTFNVVVTIQNARSGAQKEIAVLLTAPTGQDACDAAQRTVWDSHHWPDPRGDWRVIDSAATSAIILHAAFP